MAVIVRTKDARYFVCLQSGPHSASNRNLAAAAILLAELFPYTALSILLEKVIVSYAMFDLLLAFHL
jgi:hypothetical protein